MKLYNLKDHNEQVSFAQAVTQGLGKNQGLFFPHDLPEFSLTEIDEMLKLDFVTRSAKILSAFKAMSVVWNCSTGQRWHLKISAVALWHKC